MFFGSWFLAFTLTLTGGRSRNVVDTKYRSRLAPSIRHREDLSSLDAGPQTLSIPQLLQGEQGKPVCLVLVPAYAFYRESQMDKSSLMVTFENTYLGCPSLLEATRVIASDRKRIIATLDPHLASARMRIATSSACSLSKASCIFIS